MTGSGVCEFHRFDQSHLELQTRAQTEALGCLPVQGSYSALLGFQNNVETQELDRVPVRLHRTEEQSNSQKQGRARLESIVINMQFELPTR